MNSNRKVAALANWWNTYRVRVTEIEGERDEAAKVLQGVLRGVGYV
ncbi:hypothetical protein [Desulfomicrobium escambiense]|nr:hypothetical protein [Desulfomicrobium escambiense]